MLLSGHRSDLEKAIAAHGGPPVVAKALGWRLKARPRRPRGYWDVVENVRSEIDDFIADYGLRPGTHAASAHFWRSVGCRCSCNRLGNVRKPSAASLHDEPQLAKQIMKSERFTALAQCLMRSWPLSIWPVRTRNISRPM